ncbi:hypothetical protein GGR60_001746 [Xanthomonas arboricola]|nr:hypothetical protein [Xanthomonas euroxanthea]
MLLCRRVAMRAGGTALSRPGALLRVAGVLLSARRLR